ncbi:histidine kinase [Hymenobacter aerilatus]|uniref:Histidine kinase n=1 Tax=Hymenobacter aerilatus TaxID=2932251 RepID=A0A8T9SYJ2_9BACT|nr:histidine kinase [Hymenobacter aerilatus]UOR05290.1 histidine kinase [Hymenobacter aerilatus]
MPLSLSVSTTMRHRLRPWLPAWLPLRPWPHVVWLALLLFADFQLWYSQMGLYYRETESGWHFLLKALWVDAVDCALFYFNWIVLSRLLPARRLVLYVGAVVGGVLVFAALRIGISVFYAEGVQQFTFAEHVQMLSNYHLVLGLLIVLLSGGLRLAVDYVQEHDNRRELQAQHLVTELSLLKAQVNPHFLFNTLNNIYALTLQHSPRAPEAVLRLAEIMRYVLYESGADTVPLTRELTHLRGFLDLQRLRLPGNAAAAVQLHTTLATGAEYVFPIAPMLLLPLVENAFKHGHLQAPAPAVQLELQVNEAGVLRFMVRNAVAAPQAASLEAPGGVGLPNLRRRLALLYPQRHTLTIDATAQEFCATLTVQLRPTAVIL